MKNGYTVIQDWMLEMDLDLTSIFVYANIYGFSQDGESVFSGTQKWLAEKCKCSKETIKRVLKSLTEKGLIEKIEKKINGVTFYDYRVNLRLLEQNAANDPGGVKMTRGWGQNDPPYNTKENNIYKEKDNTIVLSKKKDDKQPQNPSNPVEEEKPKEKSCAKKERGKEKFDFKGALISEGVSEQTASDWLEVRAKTGGVNTLTAYKSIKKELDLARSNGISAEECIAMATTKAWRGFEYRWYVNEKSKDNGNKQSIDKRRGTDVMDVPIEDYFEPF
mgnify:CR=1 FL=1